MPWLQRKLAATIFVAPPTSSYEEALMYFKKAEEVEPLFYRLVSDTTNLIFINI